MSINYLVWKLELQVKLLKGQGVASLELKTFMMNELAPCRI
jgi:hypothetical protein